MEMKFLPKRYAKHYEMGRGEPILKFPSDDWYERWELGERNEKIVFTKPEGVTEARQQPSDTHLQLLGIRKDFIT